MIARSGLDAAHMLKVSAEVPAIQCTSISGSVPRNCARQSRSTGWSSSVSCLALLLPVTVLAADVAPTRGTSIGCSISVQDVLFGSYDPSSPAATNTIAQFLIVCTAPTLLTISIGSSRTSGSSSARRMRHGFRSETLAYNLFQDAAYTRVWGDGAVGTPLSASVSGRYAGQIFAQIFPGQDAWVGAYEDSVTITVLP